MDDIKKTRKGNLGSSDAKMVAKIAKLGKISKSDKSRIAEVLGLYETPNVYTSAMREGHEVEELFYQAILQIFSGAKSNPIFVSKIKPKHFNVINHIDVEVEKEDKVLWFEHKATKHQSIDEVEEEYKWQLQWHMMLLKERACEKGYSLKLAWFNTTTKEFSYKEIQEVPEMIEHLKKGIEIIDQACEKFEWEKPEELPVEYLAAPVQKKVEEVASALREIDNLNKKVEEFKKKLLDIMLSDNIKSIKNDYISITLVPESETVTFDAKKFKAENKELSEKYSKVVKKKPYIIIKTK
ncbi:MAG: hypothetical protein PWQ06_2783 [Anaerophaga sp.]|nr:hypothetical protein [Anaerophaga sp.]